MRRVLTFAASLSASVTACLAASSTSRTIAVVRRTVTNRLRTTFCNIIEGNLTLANVEDLLHSKQHNAVQSVRSKSFVISRLPDSMVTSSCDSTLYRFGRYCQPRVLPTGGPASTD